MDVPAYVPSGAEINNVSLESAYRSDTSGTTCRYFEVYSGSTLLATKGSGASPFSCNATTSFVTDTVSLPEVDTVAEANSLRIRTYVRNSGGLRSSDDLASLRITYTK